MQILKTFNMQSQPDSVASIKPKYTFKAVSQRKKEKGENINIVESTP